MYKLLNPLEPPYIFSTMSTLVHFILSLAIKFLAEHSFALSCFQVKCYLHHLSHWHHFPCAAMVWITHCPLGLSPFIQSFSSTLRRAYGTSTRTLDLLHRHHIGHWVLSNTDTSTYTTKRYVEPSSLRLPIVTQRTQLEGLHLVNLTIIHHYRDKDTCISHDLNLWRRHNPTSSSAF
jgi:hypothetical protein